MSSFIRFPFHEPPLTMHELLAINFIVFTTREDLEEIVNMPTLPVRINDRSVDVYCSTKQYILVINFLDNMKRIMESKRAQYQEKAPGENEVKILENYIQLSNLLSGVIQAHSSTS